MRVVFITMLLSGLLAAFVFGQTTQPADEPASNGHSGAAANTDMPARPLGWTEHVRDLAEALVSNDEGQSLKSILSADTSIRQFYRMEAQDRLSLREATSGAAIVAALNYETHPATVASDLSNAVNGTQFVPEGIRAQFTLPSDGAAVKRANEVAATWVTTTLQPGVGQPVGVIALWQEHAAEPGKQSRPAAMIFILLKGETKSFGMPRIAHIIYGASDQIAP